MTDAFICDAVRTPIGKYTGSLAHVRADDLAAVPLKALMDRNSVDPAAIDEVFYGCANQAGEDNRDVARMAALLAGLPVSVPGVTLNRLCASGADAVGAAARAIKTGEAELTIAGGVESMTRAPLVMAKATSAFQRSAQIEDTVVGWRFVNPVMKSLYGAASMPETGEMVADRYKVSREDQDRYSLQSQIRTAQAQAAGLFDDEIVPMAVKYRVEDKTSGEVQVLDGVVERDDCNRPDTTYESLAGLKPVFAEDGSVTAGNSSQLSDGASMTLVMSLEKALQLGLKPKAFFRGFTVAGCEPDEMGIGPVFSVPKLLKAKGLQVADIDLWELNEAFASQCLYSRDRLEIDNEKYNVNGGSISIGHPFGMTGSRQVGHLVRELQRRNLRYGIVTMCVGGGMGATGLFEAVR